MLLAGSISHTGKEYTDFVESFNVLSGSSHIILLILIGVEFLLCLAVFSVQEIYKPVFWSQVKYKIVLCH